MPDSERGLTYVEPHERERGTSSRKLTTYGLHDAPNWRSVGAAFIALDGKYAESIEIVEAGRALGKGGARLHVGDVGHRLEGDALYGLRRARSTAPPVRRKRASERWASNATRKARTRSRVTVTGFPDNA